MPALDRPISELQFTIEVWDDRDSTIVEVLAAARNSKVANVAYEAALDTRPNAIVKVEAAGFGARRADTGQAAKLRYRPSPPSTAPVASSIRLKNR